MDKPSISDYTSSPDEAFKLLLPYQARWIGMKQNIKLIAKSRRIGISWAEAADRVLNACQDKGSGENSFYISYEKEMTRNFIEDCADWAKAFQFAVSQVEEDEILIEENNKTIQVYRLHFNSGYRIEALSGKPRNLRSRQGTIVIDEAAFVDDLAGLLKAGRAMRIWGSNLHLISSYNGIDNEFYEFDQDVLTGKFPYGRMLIDFDIALKDGLYKRICRVMGVKWTKKAEATWRDEIFAEYGEDADEELLCIPSDSGGSYFTRSLVKNAMSHDIPVLRLEFKSDFQLLPEYERREIVAKWLQENIDLELNPNLKTSYGYDVGRVGDLSYFIAFQEQANLVKHCVVAVELRNIPFKQQEQIIFHIVDNFPRLTGGAHDARGIGMQLAESAADRYGFYRIAQVQLSDKWYGENFPKYKAGLQDKEVILPADSDLLDDHRKVESVKGVPKVPDKNRSKGSDGKQRHGDGAIACCLAWFASEMSSEDCVPAQPSQEFSWWW